MILGTGIDIVELQRINRIWQRFGERFIRRICGEVEARPRRDMVAFLAGRFAAREAAVKALGTGFSEGIASSMINVRNLASGAPGLIFSGRALERANRLGVRHVHLSISHERAFAVAIVILENQI